MTDQPKKTPWYLWPFVALWRLLGFILELTGRILGVVIGLVFVIVGIVGSLISGLFSSIGGMIYPKLSAGNS